jgi:predicted nucleic acid-binding protein
MQRIENQELLGFTSTAVLSEAAHHLMTLEAFLRFGWPSKIVQHLKQNRAAVQQLTRFRQAIAEVPQLRIRILTIPEFLIETAASISQQTGLLSNDALIVALMRHHGLIRLASEDADLDGVAGINRYAPT